MAIPKLFPDMDIIFKDPYNLVETPADQVATGYPPFVVFSEEGIVPLACFWNKSVARKYLDSLSPKDAFNAYFSAKLKESGILRQILPPPPITAADLSTQGPVRAYPVIVKDVYVKSKRKRKRARTRKIP